MRQWLRRYLGLDKISSEITAEIQESAWVTHSSICAQLRRTEFDRPRILYEAKFRLGTRRDSLYIRSGENIVRAAALAQSRIARGAVLECVERLQIDFVATPCDWSDQHKYRLASGGILELEAVGERLYEPDFDFGGIVFRRVINENS